MFVGSNGGPWSKNELCRLLHLFQEPTVMESISMIHGGLQNREQLDQKSLRGAAWVELLSKFLDKQGMGTLSTSGVDGGSVRWR